ncbi:DNA polymerase III subunit gamma/tau [Trifolium pratense]|uniref:DNA polymerase III subunit gamma/tau n=1 Tax=Trifolium pratense TaxID=57577 RepID=A0A2K3P890_TRIPR|nr:protein STICHEL-like 2 [Trifolium pratense]XP_045803484.1 protein STICHEL-like 2 [Trifolium pratense]PNY11505.1 DNA polymerase III subunit gamma/tau [Trifolium pratense]
MMDGRRHSVDIPISKTLVALRRVRSLRDPSTNSMTKHSPLIDNLHWENSSGNGITLMFPDDVHAFDSDDNLAFRSRNLCFKGQRELNAAGFESNHGMLKSRLNQQSVYGNKSPNESCGSNHGGRGLDINDLEDEELCYRKTGRLSKLGRIDHIKSAKKPLCKNQVKPSLVVGDIASHLSSPCLSPRDALSPNGSSEHTNQDFGVLNNTNNACGISCCWSKSPRFIESNLYCEKEDRPLILNGADDTNLHGHRNARHNCGEISPNLETPRMLSMKFRPKSFGDLVGQDVVVRSLLNAISIGRITSFYLFHGPRGTGKTSASRIFASALNCLSVEEQRPCGLCRECALYFSGRSKDVKVVDSVRINHTDQVKSLVKNACTPPVSSRFKVFIIDECQLLNEETWACLSNNLEYISQHAVFVMITPDLDKLPQSAVSRAQRYYFQKVKDTDIARRLETICAEEGLDYEQDALDLIAAKSCGSVRDAEIMLDQLSLLGKKIKISFVYELTGIVSDAELLDLLDLAMSPDTTNTVIRARELMRSRIDPLQLVSQLANLIMDILAGKCDYEARSRLFSRYTSEADLQKLSHALRILSEAEKQLRISKNQTTWFTVALLQLSSIDYPSTDADGSKSFLRSACNGGQSMEHLATATGGCENKSFRLVAHEDHEGTLDSIWYKATGICQSSQLKTFLRKKGKLSSLHVDQSTSCLAIAELEFGNRRHVSKAEKSWKLIASSLQSILGCNIELRITYVPHTSNSPKRLSFNNIFSCSRKIQQKPLSSNDQESEIDYAYYNSENPMMKNKTLSSSAECGSRVRPSKSYNGMDVVTTLRSCEGNVLSSRERFLNRFLQENMGASCSRVDAYNEEGHIGAHLVPPIINSDNQSNCFPRTLWLQKKFRSSNSSKLSFQGI